MTLEVRRCETPQELGAAVAPIWQFFGAEPTEEYVERFGRVMPLERMHAAFEDGRVVGGAGAFAFDLTVPGGVLPCCGTTVVGVHPTHRRRGALTQMMRAQLDEAHERGEPIAALWASEATIYGRFGFGVATLCGDVELGREHTAFEPPFRRTAEARFVDREEALDVFPRVYDRVRLETPGMYTRTRDWWETRVLLDPSERREGGGPHRRVVIELDGTPEAYAIYRHHPSWAGASATSKVRVIECFATSPQATKEVWRYLLDLDWTATFTAALLPVDHPLVLLLAESRRLSFRTADALWLRLLDVPAALSGRDYLGDGRLVLEVSDSFCPWNEGRWQLEGGQARRTDAGPDLRLGVRELGSAYLGGFTFADLQRAGRLEEVVAGAVARADGIFRTDRKPWCPEIF